MLAAGDAAPLDAAAWPAPGQPVTLRELTAGRPTLFLFYLFDWTAT